MLSGFSKSKVKVRSLAKLGSVEENSERKFGVH